MALTKIRPAGASDWPAAIIDCLIPSRRRYEQIQARCLYYFIPLRVVYRGCTAVALSSLYSLEKNVA
jgi:hypothetical protein